MSITYDDVAKACNEILKEGLSPTIRSVRAKLGKGSESTIQPLLKQWKINLSKTLAEEQLEFPAQILRDISDWARAHTTNACAQIALKLANSEQDESELTEAAKLLEVKISELENQLVDMKSSRDAAEAIAGERKIEIERLMLEADSERSTRIAATVRAVEYQAQFEMQAMELESLRTELTSLDEIRAAKIEAEKGAAVSLATCHSLQATADERAQALAESRQETISLRESIEKLRTYHASQIQFERDTINRMHTENTILAARKSETQKINYTFNPA